MDNEENKDKIEVTPEEQKAEQEALAEVKNEELRDKIAEDMDLDPDDDADLLDKLVEREKAHREKLSGAIKQKIKYRETAQKLPKQPTGTPEEGKSQEGNPDIDKIVDQKLNERLEARELEELPLSDELKAEVKDLAKLKGISVREAAKLPYILNRKEEVEKEERITAASPKRSNKGSYAPSYDPSKPLSPADFDFNTEEGRKAWNEAKAARREYEAKK